MSLLLVVVDLYAPSARIYGQRTSDLCDMASELLQFVAMMLHVERFPIADHSQGSDVSTPDAAVHRLLVQLAYLVGCRVSDFLGLACARLTPHDCEDFAMKLVAWDDSLSSIFKFPDGMPFLSH